MPNESASFLAAFVIVILAVGFIGVVDQDSGPVHLVTVKVAQIRRGRSGADALTTSEALSIELPDVRSSLILGVVWILGVCHFPLYHDSMIVGALKDLSIREFCSSVPVLEIDGTTVAAFRQQKETGVHFVGADVSNLSPGAAIGTSA